MVKYDEYLKYNVISCRVTDKIFDQVYNIIAKRKISMSNFVEEAVIEKIGRENYVCLKDRQEAQDLPEYIQRMPRV